MDIVHPENGGSRHLRKVYTYVQNYTASHRKRLNFVRPLKRLTAHASGLDSIVGFCS